MSFSIFVTAPRLAPAGAQLLQAAGCRVTYLQDPNDRGEVETVLARQAIDAVISRTVDLSAQAIQACPTLKVISKHGVGVSNIAVDAATARGIPVYVTPSANATSVAEMTLGLMFAAARRIAWMDGELRAGRWSRAQDGVELSGARSASSASARSASASPWSRRRSAWPWSRTTRRLAAARVRSPACTWPPRWTSC